MLGQTSGGWIWLAGRAAVCTQVLAEPHRAKQSQGRAKQREGRAAPVSSLLLLLVEGWPLHRQVVVPL